MADVLITNSAKFVVNG